MADPGERLCKLFLDELRSAVSARIEAGADPGEVSADLGRRLRRLRSMQQETGEVFEPADGAVAGQRPAGSVRGRHALPAGGIDLPLQ
jgi:hypothetical protein